MRLFVFKSGSQPFHRLALGPIVTIYVINSYCLEQYWMQIYL